MTKPLSKKFFINNRKRLASKLQDNQVAIVASNVLMQRSHDTEYSYRQNSNFYYLTGIREQVHGFVVVTKDSESLVSYKPNEYMEVWDGVITEAELARMSGVEDQVSIDIAGLEDYLAKSFKGMEILVPSRVAQHTTNFGLNDGEVAIRRAIESLKLDTSSLTPVLARMRGIKQPEEIELIRAAVKITKSVVSEIADTIDEYRSEAEIENELLYRFRKAGADGHSFAPIVASDSASSIIHYRQNNRELSNPSLILLDVGAEVDLYAGDISRTILTDNASPLMTQVFDSVKAVQAELIKDIVKPGLTFRELEVHTVLLLGQALHELDLIDDARNEEAIRKFYPHGVSHGLGLDVHDITDYELPLEPGMVITIEPGLYSKELGFGVRIEDDVLITESGCEVL